MVTFIESANRVNRYALHQTKTSPFLSVRVKGIYENNVLLILVSIIVSLVVINSTAMPYKTIFFITSTSSSYYPTNNNHPENPSFPYQNPSNSTHLTFFIIEVHEFHRTKSFPHLIFSQTSNGRCCLFRTLFFFLISPIAPSTSSVLSTLWKMIL
ncbi:unnamed protein product [Lactuca saligna]|uniref:Transmembrane protein n=1 Tax=Lactuca saligna TaxID=75948 RepID=A0AA35VM25_LACSI|nr:unnamed protein product [Lactuca saligna]